MGSVTQDTLHWTSMALPLRAAEDDQEAILGDFVGGDGVRFSITLHPTCYRRGRFRLLIEVAPGPQHHAWGCFDEQDQPMRWYHDLERAKLEAEAIARVLIRDRGQA